MLVLEFKLKRRKVIAEVVDSGHCRYYKKGRKFVLGGFTPAWLCESAYIVLSRDARVLACGGALPWAKEGKVLTRCPDPQGALWQLRLAINSDIEAVTSATVGKDNKDKEPPSLYKVSICRGMTDSCIFSFVKRPSLVDEIEAVVEKSALLSTAEKHRCKEATHHLWLKVAIAACPNACTQPQIKDIGIIANCAPTRIRHNCNGCGQCEGVCQEQAINVKGDRADLLQQRCVGCGSCFKNCPQEAIESEGVQFRILVGGRMGRHPRWAEELCVVDGSCVVKAVESFLERTAHHAKPSERIASVIERVGAVKLKEEIFS